MRITKGVDIEQQQYHSTGQANHRFQSEVLVIAGYHESGIRICDPTSNVLDVEQRTSGDIELSSRCGIHQHNLLHYGLD